MTATVLQFDFAKVTRLDRTNPGDFAHERETPIWQPIDRTPRTMYPTDLQARQHQPSYQLAAASLKLGFHITDVMFQAISFMTISMLILNAVVPTPLSNDEPGTSHDHMLM